MIVRFIGKVIDTVYDIGKCAWKGIPAEDIVKAPPKWGIKEKIEELATDKGLSPEYIQDLINTSNNKHALHEIQKYLTNKDKVYNLDAPELLDLVKSLKSRASFLDDAQAVKDLMEVIKEFGKEAMMP